MKMSASALVCLAAAALGLARLDVAAATYVVSQSHGAAGDDNPGTADKPLKTIGAAAKLVKAGDTVVIHAGVYREQVAVDADGTVAAPITFRAASGERVVVTGADLLTRWRKEAGEGNVFSTPWPHRFITHYKSMAHPNDDRHRMIGRAEQVFVHAYPLGQVLRRDQLSRGTFHVDVEAKRLYVWSRDNRDLTAGRVGVEASVRPLIWRSGGAHVHLKGLRFRYCANAAQRGAVRIEGSDNVVEDCVSERANSIGASFTGRRGVVRRCVFQHNGQMGFSAVRAHGMLMTGCVVQFNSTKGWDRGWEAGGNKIVLCRSLVIEKTRCIQNAGHGIWFDIGNEGCVVRNCLLAGNDNCGLFYEISYGLHARDNVIVGNGFYGSTGAWGADGGIAVSSSPGCRIERNLIVGNKEGFQFREQIRSTPKIDGRRSHAVWNHDEIVRNNLIASNRDWQVGGWFDILDGRHWPRAMQAGWEVDKRKLEQALADYKAKGQPPGLSLEKLGIRFEKNVYWARAPQGLWLWGCTWRRHKRYASVDAVRKELKLETGSASARPAFADAAALDLRLPADHPAIRMGSYPRGEVPGVRLGTR